MPEQQQQGRQQNTNLLIHDMFRGGDDTTVHWEPTCKKPQKQIAVVP
ncbi:hypothetical protein FOMA001_g15709 [Fusarium oxysporum f. sp. matthiolae]|jgi:hypothetical protein|nr:hypothetical protein FOMA001_g15709 [Fusarium oxysporum f. sp. matthiolae]